MSWSLLRSLVGAGILVTLQFPAKSQGTTYSVLDLGTFGGILSSPNAINNGGEVAGLYSSTNDGTTNAFLFDGAAKDLGTFGGNDASAYGINSNGAVVGFATTPINTSHAFVYDGTLTDLGTLPGQLNSVAYSINSAGQIAGSSGHAFLYDGTLHDLGTLGGTQSVAYSINARGQVTGSAAIAGDAHLHAFIYDGQMHDLGTLGTDTDSAGRAINDNGIVVGNSFIPNSNIEHAFLYDGTMHNLGSLGGTYTLALGMNARGDVVGVSTLANGSTRPFFYSNDTGMVDLTTLITPQADFELDGATAINDNGQITGYARVGDHAHAFLLTPLPEPASWILIATGVVSVIVYAYKKPKPNRYRFDTPTARRRR